MISSKEIEEIEFEKLEDIDNALGNRQELKQRLENSNLSISQWIKSVTDPNKIFDVGAERIIYDSLYKVPSLGFSSSWPIGSDLSFQGKSHTHNKKVLINIDCKTVSTFNFGDINGKIFIGNNQNSYATFYKNSGQDRRYKPKLLPTYDLIGEQMITLSYFVCVLYEPIPEPLNPSEIKVRLIFTCCMPNGLLEEDYKKNLKKDIISGGKGAKITAGQKLRLPNDKTYTTEEGDKFKAITKKDNCIFTKTRGITKKQILELNQVFHDLENSTARFEYLRCQNFINLNDKKRIKVKYLEDIDENFLSSKIPKKVKGGKFKDSAKEFGEALSKFKSFF